MAYPDDITDCAQCSATARALIRRAPTNFTFAELACRCGCQHAHVTAELIAAIQDLRDRAGFALPVASGWRCRRHPNERTKRRPGYHNRGMAIDLRVHGQRAVDTEVIAVGMGIWWGRGINQTGLRRARFLHLDIRPYEQRAIWSY